MSGAGRLHWDRAMRQAYRIPRSSRKGQSVHTWAVHVRRALAEAPAPGEQRPAVRGRAA